MTIQQLLMSSGGKYLTFTLVDTYANPSGTASGVTVPAGAQVGDLAIIFDATTNTTGGSLTVAAVPSGWTRISTWDYNPGTNSYAGQVLYKLLAAGDLNKTYTLSANNGGSTGKLCLVFRLNKPIISLSHTVILNLAAEGSANRLPGASFTYTNGGINGTTQTSLCLAGFTCRGNDANHSYLLDPYTITPSSLAYVGDLKDINGSSYYWAHRIVVAQQDGVYPQTNSTWTNINFNRNIQQMSFITVTT